MTCQEMIMTEVKTLPESAAEKVLEFIFFQKYSLKINSDVDNDLSDLEEVDYSDNPVMMKIIEDGINTPLEKCERIPRELYHV